MCEQYLRFDTNSASVTKSIQIKFLFENKYQGVNKFFNDKQFVKYFKMLLFLNR